MGGREKGEGERGHRERGGKEGGREGESNKVRLLVWIAVG